MRKKERIPKFSDNHDENIELQNRFLLMKIMLESDAKISSTLPQTPEMRNSFLKFVVKNKLHLRFSNKVAELLGNPVFANEKDLDQEAFQREYLRLKNLLYSHFIRIKYNRKLTDRQKYSFITTELFSYETDQNPERPMVFSYGFFRNNFKKELKEAASCLLADFFDNELYKETDYGLHLYIPPASSAPTKEKFLDVVDSVYRFFYLIEDCSFAITEIHTDTRLEKSNFVGRGYCQGRMSYCVHYNDGEKRRISGPFRIHFSLQYIGFLVNYYEIAGLNCPSELSEIID